MRLHVGSGGGRPCVSLSRDGSVLAVAEGEPTDDLLALVDAALASAGARKEDLRELSVDRGPDGFSAVRRRVAVATALARALGLGLAAVGEMTPEEAAALPPSAFAPRAAAVPAYAAGPNITHSKKTRTWTAH